MGAVLEVRNLQKEYRQGAGKVTAVKDMSFTLEKGTSAAITGPSGCGKTTLINLVGLVIRPTAGKVIISGTDSATLTDRQRAHHRNKVFGYIVQDYALIEDYSVYRNVEIPLLYSSPRAGRSVRKRMVMDVLPPLGISALAASRVKDLSGGQRQRVAIARAMVNDPLIILADEPTGSLDTKSAADISQLLHQLVAQGKTLLLVTHNLVLADSCQRQIKMADGEMVQ